MRCTSWLTAGRTWIQSWLRNRCPLVRRARLTETERKLRDRVIEVHELVRRHERELREAKAQLYRLLPAYRPPHWAGD